MATFEIYDAAGAGFDMPASSAEGYVISAGGGFNAALVYDNGSVAIFAVYGNSRIDEFTITYSIVGDTIYIEDLEYAKGNDIVLEMLDINLVGSISNLSQATLLYAEINLGDDYFGGNNYLDVIHGGPGNDWIDGYAGGDFLYGDAGDDWIFGDEGADFLYGGDGNDFVDGLDGKDNLWGGAGYDTFAFGKGYGKDFVRDLSLAEGDDFVIDKALAKNFKKLKKVAEKYKGGVVLDFKGADDLFIQGIKKKDLQKIDFDFFFFDT